MNIKDIITEASHRDEWDSNMPGYRGDYGGEENWDSGKRSFKRGEAEQEWEREQELDKQREREKSDLEEYNRSGDFWLKQKDTQEYLSDVYTGKASATEAALALLKQQPELKGNLVITAKGPEESVTEGSAHGYNVVRWYRKNRNSSKITAWLKKEAGLPKETKLYFDDADLVLGSDTVVPEALVDDTLKFNDLLTALVQITGGSAKQKVDGVYRSQDVAEDDVDEAKYQGREVPLGKKMAGDVKKSKVYVRKPNGNIVKVNFGDKKMRIKKSNPARRKSFRARHNCKNPGPRWKARYWSCRSW